MIPDPVYESMQRRAALRDRITAIIAKTVILLLVFILLVCFYFGIHYLYHKYSKPIF
jgi:hypothetical protein